MPLLRIHKIISLTCSTAILIITEEMFTLYVVDTSHSWSSDSHTSSFLVGKQLSQQVIVLCIPAISWTHFVIYKVIHCNFMLLESFEIVCACVSACLFAWKYMEDWKWMINYNNWQCYSLWCRYALTFVTALYCLLIMIFLVILLGHECWLISLGMTGHEYRNLQKKSCCGLTAVRPYSKGLFRNWQDFWIGKYNVSCYNGQLWEVILFSNK